MSGKAGKGTVILHGFLKLKRGHPPSALALCGAVVATICLSGRRAIDITPTRSAAPILPPRWRRAHLLVPCCLSGRRDGGHLHDTQHAQPHPPSHRAGAVRRCGLLRLRTRCLSGRQAIALWHLRTRPHPSSLRAGAVSLVRPGPLERGAGWSACRRPPQALAYPAAGCDRAGGSTTGGTPAELRCPLSTNKLPSRRPNGASPAAGHSSAYRSALVDRR